MKKMKKWTAMMLMAVMALSAGCGDGRETDKNPTAAVTQAPGETTAAPDETQEQTPGENKEDKEEQEPVMDEATARMASLTSFDIVKDMKIGWNLGNTLDSTNTTLFKTSKATKWETSWGNPVTTEELIKTVIDRGFNVIRIPVSWNDHLMPGGKYEIEAGWMDRVQEVVDYAYKNGAYVILDTHHESWYEPYYDNQEQASKILAAVWTQIAERFADYDEHLIFQGMNEPRKIGTSVEWNGGDKEGRDVVNALNNVFIEAVRATGGKNAYRSLMISCYGANGSTASKSLELPEDLTHIIVSVHAYVPYDFALNLNGTGLWNNKTTDIDSLMKLMDTLFISKGVPVIIDEFGAMTKSDEGNELERAAWGEYYVRKAKELDIPCVWWDNGVFEGNGERFGIIDRNTYEWKYETMLEGLMKGLEAE